MLAIVLTMIFGLLVAGAVVLYVAYPHRGEEVPVVPKVGEVMRKSVDALPTLEDTTQR